MKIKMNSVNQSMADSNKENVMRQVIFRNQEKRTDS